jgi:hypothetical protein
LQWGTPRIDEVLPPSLLLDYTQHLLPTGTEPEQSQESSNLWDYFRTDPRAKVMVSALNISLLEKDSDAISSASYDSINFDFCQGRIWQKNKKPTLASL